ncbi:MAG: hypothetical protein ACO34J_06640 [Prochlorothrix sp.]
MGNPSLEPFTDNWSYIKTELNWLERLLMVAVGQQRRDWQETAGFAQNQRDQVTRHWWKGVISLNQNPNYDEKRPTPPPNGEAQGYQQQLTQRIQGSRQKGVILSLPSLQERLQLTPFEKNLVLMGLAPEVNRRYIKLFNYLQGEERDRPLVDLALKLLCRNDQDWQAARSRLTTASPLVQRGLLQFLGSAHQPLLLRGLYLPEHFVNFLLTHQIQAEQLEQFLGVNPNPNPLPAPPLSPGTAQRSVQIPPPSPNFPSPNLPNPNLPNPNLSNPTRSTPPYNSPPRSPAQGDPWLPVVLPLTLHQSLKTLGQRYTQGQGQSLTPAIGSPSSTPIGDVLLWTGPSGTGKTFAAQTLAVVLGANLCQVDLLTHGADRTLVLLEELTLQPPLILVLEPAPLWLGWRGAIASAPLQALLKQRCQQGLLTIFEGQRSFPPAWIWKPWIQQSWTFPRPDAAARERIWQQSFPFTVALDPALPWPQVAQRWELTGGDIAEIARSAQTLAQSRGGIAISLSLLEEAWKQHQRLKGDAI